MFQGTDELRQQVAHRIAAPMFFLSFLFLALLATILVLTADVYRIDSAQRLAAKTAGAQSTTTTIQLNQSAVDARHHCLLVLALIWPLFLAEFAFQFAARDRNKPYWRKRYYGFIVCLIPPLRLCARNPDMGGQVWLPGMGWQDSDDALRRRLDHTFSIPMILIALTILPILLIEFLMTEQIAARPWLRAMLHISMGVIWFAFAVEFIVMVSVAEKKLRYCKEHWLDLAIILLPLVSFLRSLRVIRATRLARVAKVQQLTKMGRLYRLRGLAMRALRAILFLEVLHRIFGISLEKKLKSLRAQLEEKEREVAAMRTAIVDLERQIQERAQKAEKPASSPAEKPRFHVESDVATEDVT